MPEKTPVIKTIFNVFRLIKDIVTTLIFWIILLIVIIVIAFSSSKVNVRGNSIVIIDPTGFIVDSYSESENSKMLQSLQGYGPSETLLSDLIDTLKFAAEDRKIEAVYINLTFLRGAGAATLKEFRDQIVIFKESGKKVYAYALGYNESAYYLASAADEIIMDSYGWLDIDGYGRYRNYYKDALDKFGLDSWVFRAGDYKAAVEPFLRNDMSDEDKEVSSEMLNDLWRTYLEDVTEFRTLNGDELQNIIITIDEQVSKFQGDIALMAKELGLVDSLVQESTVYDILNSQRDNENDTEPGITDLFDFGLNFNEINYRDYILASSSSKGEAEIVALLTLSGNIIYGEADWGSIGSENVKTALNLIEMDPRVKALVIRIDSGGGSALGSEEIRRALQKISDKGIPIVVSMSDVAASGAYWISTPADVIMAQPNSITGSIGVFAFTITYQDFLKEYIGINTDGVGTTPIAEGVRSDMAMDPQIASLWTQSVEDLYSKFINLVADSRGMTLEEVQQLGGGRVFSGVDAVDNGLIDYLGGVDDALIKAAELAMLEDWSYARYNQTYMQRLNFSPLSLMMADYFPTIKVKQIELLKNSLDSGAIMLNSEVSAEMAEAANYIYSFSTMSDPRSLYLFSGYEDLSVEYEVER